MHGSSMLALHALVLRTGTLYVLACDCAHCTPIRRTCALPGPLVLHAGEALNALSYHNST
jgi:hypothetical protein